jgi:transitional endoplasmic reticulum ATPase
VQQIARLFNRARQVAPTIIFIDEIDSLVPARGASDMEPQVTARVVNTMLAEMDGMEELNSIIVIGATNRPWLVDPALLRTGRFDELVYVGPPDASGRKLILGIHTRNMPLAKDVDLDSIAAGTERYTGADLEDVVRRAGLVAIRRAGEKATDVTAADFAEALEDSRPTVTEQMEADYEAMKGELKKRAMEVRPFGFISEGMVTSTREKKHP